MSAKRDIKLVGFDANGTFFNDADPEGGIFYEALNVPFDRFGMPRLSIPELRERFTQPWTKIYRDAGITEAMASEADLYEIYNTAYQAQPSPNLAPGVFSAVARLCSDGIAVAIVSTQQNALTVPLLERHGVSWSEHIRQIGGEPEGYPYLKAIIGGVHDKAAALRNLLAEMSLMPEEAVYVGDQDSDMVAARQAGYAAIAYLGGVHAAERLARAGAQYFLRNYELLHSLTLFNEEHPEIRKHRRQVEREARKQGTCPSCSERTGGSRSLFTKHTFPYCAKCIGGATSATDSYASYARGDDPGPFTDIIASR